MFLLTGLNREQDDSFNQPLQIQGQVGVPLLQTQDIIVSGQGST